MGFDTTRTVVTLTPSTTSITTAAQQTSISAVAVPAGPMLLSTAGGTFGRSAIDGAYLIGAVSSGSAIPLILTYTSADNGQQTLAITVEGKRSVIPP
jgi:hypothetical protein